jgi:hypothetical protein
MPSEPPTERLIRVLETASRVPLMRESVRVDCVEVLKLVDLAAGSAHARATGETPASAEQAAALEAIRQAVLEANPIPFTDQVRMPADLAADLAEQLRRVS